MDGSSILVMCWTDSTALCKALRFRVVQLPYQVVMQLVRILYGAPVEIAENPGIHVEPLSGRLPDGVSVMGPGQVITDVDPEEPEAADLLHRSPVDGGSGVVSTHCLFL